LAAVGFGREDVALRVGGDAVHGVELAGLAAAIAEAGQNLHGVALYDVDLFVGAIGEGYVLLLWVFGERDVPHRPIAQGVARDEEFLEERAVGLERLDAIVRPVADVEHAV